MKNLFLLVLICLSIRVFAQEPTPTSTTEYSINAELHDHTKTLNGFLKVNYINNSPDTVSYIWFKLVPNAFSNDMTAFSEHMLGNDRTDFYFASKEKKGYMNNLSFRANGISLKVEEHPRFIELVRVILEKPIYPGDSILLVTPFQTKIPYMFNEMGYNKSGYSLKYWYPAVVAYSKEESGKWRWHDKPYINNNDSIQPARYNVNISLPAHFNIETNGRLIESHYSDSLKQVSLVSDVVSDFFISMQRHNATIALPGRSAGSLSVCGFFDRLQEKRILPAAGYNYYDGLQAGILFQSPLSSNSLVTYHVAPMFGFKSKRLTGAGQVNIHFSGGNALKTLVAGISAASFSMLRGTDSSGVKVFGGVEKISPAITAHLNTRHTKISSHVEYRFFLLRETDFQYNLYSFDSLHYPSKKGAASRYVNQVSYSHSNQRILYPYSATVQLQQGKNFYRLNAAGSYFFNYARRGGLNMRMFVSRFGYLGKLSSSEKFRLHRFKPKLTANNGYEDFTYSNYFIARNDPERGLGETMMRDGNLKIKTDIFDGLQGRSDKWAASLNMNTTLPQLTPLTLPLRLFIDVGTYAEAWDENHTGSRLMYVAGLQLSLFNDVMNVYVPVFFSREIRDRLKSVPEENRFIRKIIFNLSLQTLRFSRPLCKQIL